MSDNEPSRIRVALAVIAAFAAAGALYAILRVGQAFVFREADPALILFSAHAGYFWRAWTAAYIGGMVGFVAWVFSRTNTVRLARGLAHAVVVTTLLVLLQSIFWP